MRRLCILLLVLASVAALLGAGLAAARCTKPKHHLIGQGALPTGEAWSVTAGIRNNGTCREWLFDLEFSLGEFGNAGSATGIPAGGHVPREYFKLSGNDLLNPARSERVFYGYTGVEGTRIVALLENGKVFAVKPQLAPKSLRKKVAWLRSFRFFVYFHPTGSPIETVSVFTRGGRLLYRARSVGGDFF